MRIKLALIFITIIFQLSAQPPANFQSKFGGEGDDIGYSAKVTKDGNYIITGLTSSYGNNNTDVYLVKLSNTGQGMWTEHIGGSGIDVGRSIILMPDSGFVIAGFTTSFGNGGYDAYIFRTDKYGKVKWQQTYGSADWDFGNDVVLGNDGHLFMVGYSFIQGQGKDAFVVKFDTLGVFKGVKYYGGILDDEFSSIISTSDFNLCVVGNTKSGKDQDGNGWFMKLDLNLDTLFSKEGGGPYKDYFTDVMQKSNGDYQICGAATYSAGGFTNATMFGYNSVGDSTWSNNYNFANQDDYFVSLTKSNHLPTLTGYLRNVPFPSLKIQAQVFVADPGGWAYLIKQMGGLEDDYLFCLESTDDGGYFGVGQTTSYESQGKDVFVVKLDSTILNYAHIEGIGENIESNSSLKIKYINEELICFEVKENSEISEISLFSAEGVRCLSNSGTNCCDISFLSPGVFFAEIKMKNGTYFRRKIARIDKR